MWRRGAADNAAGMGSKEDTVYAVLYVPEGTEGNPIGYTDSHGEFLSTNRALFPSACTYPSLTAVDEDGAEHGNFTFEDTLMIAVVDAATQTTREYAKLLTPDGGGFDLTW